MSYSNIIKFIPAILWMIVIFYFSSQSTAGIGYGNIQKFIIFKTLHLIEYSVLGILVYFAVNTFNHSIIISYLYAISDEIHQRFTPGRGPKFSDTLIDLLGIIIGLIFVYYFNQRLKKPQNKIH